MNARDLAADVPADLLEAIERRRSVSLQTFVPGAVALAALIAWVWWLDQAAAEHHHRTALWLGLVPIIVLDVVYLGRRRLRPHEREVFTGVGRLALWTSVAALAVLTALTVHRDGGVFGVLVGFGVVLPTLVLLSRAGTWLLPQFQVLRGRAQRVLVSADAAAEWSADRAAWAAANNDWRMGEGPLRRWLNRWPQQALGVARVVPATSGVDVRFGKDMQRWAHRLGPGVERVLEDGRVVVSRAQLRRSDGLALLSIDDRVVSIGGSAGWFERRFDWRRHAATVVAAELAAGSAALVSAVMPSKSPADARLRHFALIGGTGRQVPMGCLADQRARLPRLQLPASPWNGRATPGIDLIPPPSASVSADDGSAAAPDLPRRLIDDLTALVPGLHAEPDPSMPRDPGARLWLLAQPDRIVVATLMPAEPGWSRKGERRPFELLVRCETLGLVTVLSLRTESRSATLHFLAALLRHEEEAVEQTVYVPPDGTGDHRTVPVHTKPAEDRLPVVARGMRFGETVVWWPLQGVGGRVRK